MKLIIFLKNFIYTSIAVLLVFALYINYNMYNDIAHLPSTSAQREFAIVLGASVYRDELSEALRARMLATIALFKRGLVKYILLSGDGTKKYYNETVAMKQFAIRHGIPEENILTDEKGYNTYASIWRAHNIFKVDSAFIISQNFHLIRLLWLCKSFDIDAQGISAGELRYAWYYDLREFFARVKDYTLVKLKLN